MLDLFLDSATDVFAKGGAVMPVLLLATGLLWYGLGYRAVTLRRGVFGSLRTAVAAARGGGQPRSGIIGRAIQIGVAEPRDPALRDRLELAYGPLRAELRAWQPVVRTVVVLAPLLGLLGTVAGMIETFDSLADMAMFTQGGGIAAGVSEALFTTQMGLAVAIPGQIVGRLLERRQTLLEDELDELQDLLCQPALTIVRAA